MEAVFKKNGFSQNLRPILENQRCPANRCKTRKTMKLPPKVNVNGKSIKLDFRCTCATESVIYLGVCKLCGDEDNSDNFYFGQTVNSLMSRCNGHRDKFKISCYDQSALALHVMDKHHDSFGEKLECFDFGVVDHVSPEQLNRREDFYIYITNADKYGLNRYKVSK